MTKLMMTSTRSVCPKRRSTNPDIALPLFEMASSGLGWPRRKRLEARHDAAADILRQGAARVEHTAGRRVERARHLALDGTLAALAGADPRHRLQQRARIGMGGALENIG